MAGNMQDKQPVNKEWDLVDLQVCLSRELKQRVLVCQFIKCKEVIASNSSDTMLFQDNSNVAPPALPLNKQPYTASFVRTLQASHTVVRVVQ